MLKSFFLIHNIIPTWISAWDYGYRGKYDEETGDWDGAVGLVRYYRRINVFQIAFIICFQLQRNEADLAIGRWQCKKGPFGPSYVALCPPAIEYNPYYWWSRYPPKRTKILNLTELLSPISWMLTFVSMFTIVVSLKLFTFVGTRLGLDTFTEETSLPYFGVKLSCV